MNAKQMEEHLSTEFICRFSNKMGGANEKD